MKNKKEQPALEFLMIYGWAILSAIIVIGVLAYFGVFTPNRYSPQSTANYTCLAKSLCESAGLNYSSYLFMNGGNIYCKIYILENVYWNIDFQLETTNWTTL